MAQYIKTKGTYELLLRNYHTRLLMRYTFQPNGVCSKQINFDIIGDVITNISFIGGCDGNLKAISKLCNGMTVSEIENKLLGNDCKGRGTSCADQFAKAVREAFNSNKQ